MADWAAIETALQAWVVAASGLPADSVVWADQNMTRPDSPYIVIRLMDVIPVGGLDQLTWDYDAGRPSGHEILQTIKGVREFGVSLQCFSIAMTGNDTARVKLYAVQTKLRLPSIRDALRAAGLSPFDRGEVQNLAEKLGEDFIGRAALVVRFYMNDTTTESTGYIETVAGTGTFGEDGPTLDYEAGS